MVVYNQSLPVTCVQQPLRVSWNVGQYYIEEREKNAADDKIV